MGVHSLSCRPFSLNVLDRIHSYCIGLCADLVHARRYHRAKFHDAIWGWAALVRTFCGHRTVGTFQGYGRPPPVTPRCTRMYKDDNAVGVLCIFRKDKSPAASQETSFEAVFRGGNDCCLLRDFVARKGEGIFFECDRPCQAVPRNRTLIHVALARLCQGPARF